MLWADLSGDLVKLISLLNLNKTVGGAPLLSCGSLDWDINLENNRF